MTPDGSLLHSTDRLPDLLTPRDVLTAVNDLAGFRPHYVRDRWCFLIDLPPESEKSAEHYAMPTESMIQRRGTEKVVRYPLIDWLRSVAMRMRPALKLVRNFPEHRS